MPATDAIDATEVHLWHCGTEVLQQPGIQAACEALLLPDERQQWRRFLVAHAAESYLLTRAMMRTVLSRYAPVAPLAWTFRRNAHGRPEISGPTLDLPLRFNLSNTRGLVVCGVTAGWDLGVDVENLDRKPSIEVADNHFAPEEVRALRSLPREAQSERFLTYWTLKEAYIKARGLGLAIPLQDFALTLSATAAPTVAFSGSLNDDPAAWQFGLAAPAPRYLAAVAVRRGQAPDVRVRLRPGLPL
ncbi:MAG TPA: 4'-phosphopantetheinyl transferase superfamily protein [Myxococcota bacterium]|nr:4'-phosphopantetheinyl transferase superfamily protein [Myxococcota bacterium]